MLPCLWVFQLKHTKDGQVDRFKARLVAKGYKQQHGIDFNEVYSPVSKFSTLRALLSIAAASDWEIVQIDIKTAFLNGQLDEEIFMQPPEGYTVPPNTVCKLQKSLYGLRQAPRMWYKALCEVLQKMNFTASDADASLFICKDNGKLIFVLVYVDDILIFSPDTSLVNRVKEAIFKEFSGRELKGFKSFLDFKIS